MFVSFFIPKVRGLMNNSKTLKKVCGIGVFAALAYVTTCICKLIPSVQGFLSLDAKDAIIAIASFVYGPLVAPIISLVVALIEFITISETGFWGLIMNFTASTVFSFTASLIYKYRKTYGGVIIGFCVATVLTVTVMIGLNPLIVPLYSGAPREVVVSMIPTVLLPFNFAKTVMNSAIALLLYKPIINAMRSAKLLPKSEYKTTFNKTTILTLIIGGVSLFSALLVLLIIW